MAVAHRKLTGEDKVLDAAVCFADHIDIADGLTVEQFFQQRMPEQRFR